MLKLQHIGNIYNFGFIVDFLFLNHFGESMYDLPLLILILLES